ncbi:MFS transporter [Flavitalea sp. BT771]|uniref:MFS transporter n=1 Tax=Flavitalea sp. BT771 TaxID=3063329 RepID=UPI0026E4675C|nr:MFS transporter [Flavitalea sp. BT771]MDO6432837.1 MFS transporter [Flavitalea sp. BT771]MDV6221887.1 MFS transporter [Flavitalea sp. BT771]
MLFQGMGKLSPGKYNIATVVVYFIVPISGFGTDIYLPSMPAMAHDLRVSDGAVQLTLSLFLVSYGLSQLISGSFLDAFGRYRISMTALLVFSASCLATAWSKHIALIYAMRVLQGLCVGFIVVAARAFFSDIYEGEKRRGYISLMTIVWSVGPIVAPFVGGYLEHSFGWRSNFYALAIYGLLLFTLQGIFSGETIRIRAALHFRTVLGNYRKILSAADFVAGLLMLGLSYAMIMFFSLTGPFVIEHTMHYSPVVAGYVSLLLGAAWMCGGFFGKGLIRRPFLPKNRVGYLIQGLLVLAMMAASFWLSNVWTMVAFAFVIHVTAGFVFNNYFTYCLARFPQAAGTAGGLAGGLAYTITSLLSYGIAATIRPVSQLEIGEGYFLITLIGVVVLWVSGKRYGVK